MFKTEKILVREISHKDTSSLHDYILRNRRHFQEWEPLREESYFSELDTESRVLNMLSAIKNDSAMHFVIIQDERLIGCINYTNIIRGPFMACHLGFSIDKDSEGKGYMSYSLTKTLEYMKNECLLHRVMANYMPHNKRSERLLARLNFKKEGYAESYLKINGRWQDHILTSLVFS